MAELRLEQMHKSCEYQPAWQSIRWRTELESRRTTLQFLRFDHQHWEISVPRASQSGLLKLRPSHWYRNTSPHLIASQKFRTRQPQSEWLLVLEWQHHEFPQTYYTQLSVNCNFSHKQRYILSCSVIVSHCPCYRQEAKKEWERPGAPSWSIGHGSEHPFGGL